MLGGGAAVIGPPPGMPLHESAALRGMSLGTSGNVVAPAPGLPMRDSSAGPGVDMRGTASGVVPPPPTMAGSGTLASARGNSLSGVGSQVAIPTPSLGGAGAIAGETRRAAMTISPTGAPLSPRKIEDPNGQVIPALPLRIIGLALALPSSSYFSNYEVFIAERRIAKEESQLIKLVYESRPYQRRMSEYDVSDARIVKVRVRRDASCDETAAKVLGDHYPKLQTSSNTSTLGSIDADSVLPCYRTTVDEYRKAISHGR
nr:hypothetical protein [uncultured bacterium]